LICIFQVTTNWQSTRQTRYAYAQWLEMLLQIERGCVTFHAGIRCEDHFLELASRNACNQLFDLQIVGADAFDGR
jgi:hypothetical protein